MEQDLELDVPGVDLCNGGPEIFLNTLEAERWAAQKHGDSRSLLFLHIEVGVLPGLVAAVCKLGKSQAQGPCQPPRVRNTRVGGFGVWPVAAEEPGVLLLIECPPAQPIRAVPPLRWPDVHASVGRAHAQHADLVRELRAAEELHRGDLAHEPRLERIPPAKPEVLVPQGGQRARVENENVRQPLAIALPLWRQQVWRRRPHSCNARTEKKKRGASKQSSRRATPTLTEAKKRRRQRPRGRPTGPGARKRDDKGRSALPSPRDDDEGSVFDICAGDLPPTNVN